MSILSLRELEEAAGILTGTLNEYQRQETLDALAARPSSDGARLLADLFSLTPWSPHRCSIVRALGRFTDQRTVEFLFRLALSDHDLTIAREAVLTLGRVGSPLAQEILLALARRPSYPFRRESIQALGLVQILTVGDELESLFRSLKSTLDEEDPEVRLMETALLSLATHGRSTIDDDFVNLMERTALRLNPAHPSTSGDLLNSCLLAAGSLDSQKVLVAVAKLNLNHLVFSANLRSTMLAQGERLSRPNLESVLFDLEAAVKNRRTLQLAWLQRFSSEELHDARAILAEELGPEVSLWVELAAVAQRTASAGTLSVAEQESLVTESLALLQLSSARANAFQVAFAFKITRSLCAPKHWRTLLKELDHATLIAAGQSVPDATVHDLLCRKITSRSGSSATEFTALCNVLVSQTHMAESPALVHRSLSVLESVATDSKRVAERRARAIRALGQTSFCLPSGSEAPVDFAACLEQIFQQQKLQSPIFPSLVRALGSAPSEATLSLLLRMTQEQLELPAPARAPAPVIELLFSNLILFPREHLKSCTLTLQGEELNGRNLRRLTLRLLGLGVTIQKTTGESVMDDVIASLQSSDFSEIVLALEAAHQLRTEGEWLHVHALLNHEHSAIRSLALERICRSRQAALQNRLCDYFSSEKDIEAELLLHCFDVFEIDPSEPPEAFARFLQEASQEGESARPSPGTRRRGPFQRSDVRQEAMSLAEQILFVAQNRNQPEFLDGLENAAPHALLSTSPSGSARPMGMAPGSALTPLSDRELVDQSLKKDLPLFECYSEVLKTVLRNAELPFSHPKIFGDRVDKSTAIIEFVKSIDLLLQERIGEPLFLGSRPEVLAKLRSRISRLGLHEIASDNIQTLRLLEIEHIFTPELFPSIKLTKLSHSILAGKFVSEQLRILDGLKGWAVFLLLFARPLRFGGTELEPVLEVTPQPQDRVARLAWEMILLQERRNIAAHRGTIIDAADIRGLRAQSVAVLATIDSLFALPRRTARSRILNEALNDGARAADSAQHLKRGA